MVQTIISAAGSDGYLRGVRDVNSSERLLRYLKELEGSHSGFLGTAVATLNKFATLFHFLTLPKIALSSKANLIPNESSKVALLLPRSRFGQNVLVLDAARANCSGGTWRNIRKHLNGATTQGLTLRQIPPKEALASIDTFTKARRYSRSAQTVMRQYHLDDPESFLGYKVLDAKGSPVALACGFFAGEIFNLALSITLLRGEARWVAHEAIVRGVWARGVHYIRVSNFLAMEHGDCVFSEQLGYRHFNFTR